MNKKSIMRVFCIAVMCLGFIGLKKLAERSVETDLNTENIEALSDSENSGAKCPNGCKNIGWGFDKILECDCNYDHFSICKSWGC